ETKIELNAVYKPLKTLNDIVPVKDKNVSAVIYTNPVLLPNTMPVVYKKKAFIDMILPSILVSKYKLSKLHEKVLLISKKPEIKGEDKKFIDLLFKKYKTTKIDILLTRLTTHPTSVVLAQAAVESGWGGSRFFIKANNIFGIWSFNKNEKRIPALGMRGAKTIYLKKYDSLEESISDYFKTLGTSKSFKNFRNKRLLHKDPLELIKDLQYYSELREEYVEKLRKVIVQNNLSKYDDYQLSLDSFKEVIVK
ncbi:MAG: glucosaminidase domain-containing protein, partial [Campylobacterales bacterium]|nr:glucosaminidase domain-containing protein [Campylobacterales bacterium]